VYVEGADGREYELVVDVLRDAERRTIQPEACVAADAISQDLLRLLPKWTSTDLDGCVQQFREAIEDLVEFEDLVPGKAGPV
jgi:hypothetical protein